MPLSARARIEVFLPDHLTLASQELLIAFNQEFTHTFGGATLWRGLDGSYLAQSGQTVRDRINLLYTDTPLSLEENADQLSSYMTKLRQAVLDALQEELSRPFQDRLERLLVERVVICLFQLELADAELAGAEKRPASERGDVRKCHEAAQRAFDQAQKALSRHRQVTKAGPSPIDLLRPVAERSPAGKDRMSATRRAGDGVGAGVA